MEPPRQNVTALLNAWGTGDETAGNELIELVYKELRRLASHYLQSERPDHTLQPTALVHELYLKLFSSDPIEWNNRGHFLAVAARQLRHIVIDYARSQQALKRGGAQCKLSLDEVPEIELGPDGRILDLNRALDRLEELDRRSAKVVELRYFGGLTESEIAEALNCSVATVKRDWEFARTWLLKEIG
jgi:RNA polymerase sigma factor (TIGR02999 family)